MAKRSEPGVTAHLDLPNLLALSHFAIDCRASSSPAHELQ
jgi:hypothetical protein